MPKNKRSLNSLAVSCGALLAAVLLSAAPAHAIPPPDFVVNAGMQIAQGLGVAIFFCSAGLAYLFRRFRSFFNTPLRRTAGWTIIGCCLAASFLLWFGQIG